MRAGAPREPPVLVATAVCRDAGKGVFKPVLEFGRVARDVRQVCYDVLSCLQRILNYTYKKDVEGWGAQLPAWVDTDPHHGGRRQWVRTV